MDEGMGARVQEGGGLGVTRTALAFSVGIAVCASVSGENLRVDRYGRYGLMGTGMAERGSTAVLLPDGGFLVAGWADVTEPPVEVDAYLIRTDSVGGVLWERHVDNCQVDEVFSAGVRPDGGFIIAGSTKGGARRGQSCLDTPDLYLLRTDAAGNRLWSVSLGTDEKDVGRSVAECRGGGFIVAGSTRSGPGPSDVYVVKVSAEGEVIWERAFGGKGGQQAFEITETEDGDYVIAGEAEVPNEARYAYVLKVNGIGDLVWERSFGVPGVSEHARSLVHAGDGAVVLAGQTSRNGDAELYLAKVDRTGTLE